MESMNGFNSSPLSGPVEAGVHWNESFRWSRPELPPEMEDYQLSDRLGVGSTGAVYRSVLKKEFAVKIVQWWPRNLREVAKREYDVARLFDDCETTVHSIAYYEHQSRSYILQEFGEPVLAHFFRNSCTLRMVLQALLDISGALSQIHSQGYTHFDVKPSNILVIQEKARLGDFSHCRRFLPGQEYERTFGTDMFRAPEIVPGGKHSGLEDMYSLGITMYTLLMAGILPSTEGKDEKDKDTPDRCKLPIQSLFIPAALLSVIQKATALKPAGRYQTFEELSADIRNFMETHRDDLDEKVPTYIPSDSRRPTVPLPMTVPESASVRCEES